MAYLVVSSGGRELDRRELKRPILIGRSLDSDICLQDARLSRQHCRLEPQEGQWILIDLQSRNGTFVDGARITRHVLQDGETFQAGQTRFAFHADAFVPARPAAPDARPERSGCDDRAIASDDTSSDAVPVSRPQPMPTPRHEEMITGRQSPRPSPAAAGHPHAMPIVNPAQAAGVKPTQALGYRINWLLIGVIALLVVLILLGSGYALFAAA